MQHRTTEEFVHSIDKQTILNIMSINNLKKVPWSFQPKFKKVFIIPKYKLQSDLKKHVILAETDFRDLQTICTVAFQLVNEQKNIYFKYNLEHKV